MFIDEIKVKFKAGDGGPGTVSFRKEKYIPYGGPDGGNGGNGGKVVIVADEKLENLAHLVKTGILKAENGRPGSGSKKHGHDGKDMVVPVPVGTLVRKNEEAEVELDAPGKELVVGQGGRGGMGNAAFASAVNRTPRVAQKGEEGEEGSLHLQASLACDIGIVGAPSSGRSTLLNRLTGVQVKIADYPFTTREVIRGVLERGGKTFLVTETPGIMEGSHAGRGLGLGFLRHIHKARVLIHLVDGSAPDILRQVQIVDRELEAHDSRLVQKPRLLAINKIDLPEVRGRIDAVKEQLRQRPEPVFFISARDGEGLEKLVEAALRIVGGPQPEAAGGAEEERIILLPGDEGRNSVYRKKNVWVIESPDLEEVLKRTDIHNQDAQAYLKRQFMRIGVIRLIKKEGVQVGERVRCGGVEWEWQWPL